MIREEVAAEVRRALAELTNGAPWMTTEEVATLLGTTPAAIRQRLHGGWLKHDRAKDGRRVLLRRAAVLAALEARRR